MTIDESMIKYSGHTVTFVHYISKKPNNQSTKGSAACCAYMTILLWLEIYIGYHRGDENSALVVVT